MSTIRLFFLYPHFFRSLRVSESTTQKVRIRALTHHQCLKLRAFATTGQRREQRFVQRHGKAVEPFLVDGETEDTTKVFTPEESPKEAEKSKDATTNKPGLKEGQNVSDPSSAASLSEETQAVSILPGDESGKPTIGGTARRDEPQAAQSSTTTADVKAPLETVLEVPPPESLAESNASKPPHLQTPPYVHHFDTYTLVQQVESGGFTKEQSITAMKAVRGLLALNLDVARAGLVSKSDVENETYLFRAACSELKTEVQNNRRANEEAMRRERTLLQHEVDILNQKLNQELLSLKDDLKGMFDDRKMSVRQEQRTMESAIQELNYKITVSLNSDSKSEVEGLRWVLTRRSVMGILFMAFMVLTSLRLCNSACLSLNAANHAVADPLGARVSFTRCSNRRDFPIRATPGRNINSPHTALTGDWSLWRIGQIREADLWNHSGVSVTDFIMSGEGSGSFSAFWHRSTDKISPKKLKFIPNVTKPGNGKEGDDPASAALSAKQHRRAQVRKAQIEHRQRKANYVKSLEQDVIDLREMIAASEVEAAIHKQENEAIKRVMLNSNIVPPAGQRARSIQLNPFVIDFELQNHISPNSENNTSPPQQEFEWSSGPPPNSIVSVGFDDFLDTSCLNVSPLNTYNPAPDIINSPDIFNFPSNSFTVSPKAATSSPGAPNAYTTATSPPAIKAEPDLETIAINFILALEHPCRKHFHHHPPDTFDGTTPESGHELMASTHLYASAPAPVFTNLDSASWKAVSPSLDALYAMSRSLPKGDWEITPVQAWFLLVERWGIERIVGELGKGVFAGENVIVLGLGL
ncbi:hypothetical protein G7Y89_g46 [Cudoniella acicularis]|uniref:BZIP domain-containing protein n=1 Tax=Cudoniella acicularis TaxID=354080 RepID=A0A8H4RXW5_9HELO|nr:hypothetical protein G7Y89_g46 [Cudoniella acicularis]